MAEIRIWNEEQKTQQAKEYYIILVDGDQTVPFILKYDASKKEVIAEPYSPPDINYTIHDGCDHENDVCALDYPDSWEAQEVQEAESYGYALRNLQALERQVRQQRIAERLNRPMDPVEVENKIAALLKELPAHYPEPKFTKEERGYVLEIDRTLIFNGVSAEDAIKHTRHYVEARKESSDLPIGVIYGIYD
jgi:hypothetical protein